MGIGAVCSEAGYYGYDVANRSSRSSENGVYSTVGSATRETTSSNDGKTIGIVTVGNFGYLAKYADSSTPEEPVIKVGDYEIKINEVDPNNATQLEMFAWTSYMEDIGGIEKSGMSSYSEMKAYAVQSQYDGVCSGIYDGADNEDDFWSKKQNWGAIISNAKSSFANIPDTYAQSLECEKMLSYFEKWATRLHEGRTEVESFADDSVNDVMPAKATQAEMYALFTYHDSVNGTEHSYEKFMAYMDTAKSHEYWKGNDTYDQFANDAYNWGEMLSKVIGDASKLGLQNVASEGWALHDTIEKAFISKIDFDSMKENMKVMQGERTYTLPDIPKDISNSLFSSFFSEEFRNRYGDENLAILENRIEQRIAEQIDADGTRGAEEGMWNSAISVLESLCDELDSFFGEKLGSWDSVKEEAAGLKQMYGSIINNLQEAKKTFLGEKEPAQSEEDDFRQMLVDYIAELYEKIKNGDTEQEFQIGSMSLTLTEWDELIDKFDDLEEEIKEAVKAEIEKKKEAERAEKNVRTDDSIDNAALLSSEIRKSVFREATDTKPELSYITCFTGEGIICKETGMGENEYLWKMDFENEQDYEKVMDLINSFPGDWNLKFAPNEKFWKDYLSGRIDKDDFVSNLNPYSDKGKMNYLIERDGNTYINPEAAKYANYMNSPRDRIYNLQEFTELITNEIKENQKRSTH